MSPTPATSRTSSLQRNVLGAVLLFVMICALGCDETDCEQRCSDRWFETCEECADEPPLFESECAEIWCDEEE